MCRVLRVAPSGFYAWIHKPMSVRAKEDRRLLTLIRASHASSGGIYGSPRVFLDLREAGEACGRHRIARIMREHKMRGAQGYKVPRAVGGGPPSIVAPNRLKRQFRVDGPDKAWVTDITYVRTWQGWLYLAVVVDLYSRRVVGWSMKPSLAKELVLDAIVMAVWRRRPDKGLLIHSDQGSQYSSDDFQRFCRAHHLELSMSRRANCWDNAVAESFLWKFEERKNSKENLSHPQGGEGRSVRLHRDVLQSYAAPQLSRWRQSRSLRGGFTQRLLGVHDTVAIPPPKTNRLRKRGRSSRRPTRPNPQPATKLELPRRGNSRSRIYPELLWGTFIQHFLTRLDQHPAVAL